jgi:hypothetical protein
MALSRAQRFFTWLFPASWAASMEADSRTWIVRCSACGHAESMWDRGGIRWKARGNPRIRIKCPACGEANWHTVTRTANAES